MADRGEEPPPKRQNGDLNPDESSSETDLGNVGEEGKSPSHPLVDKGDSLPKLIKIWKCWRGGKNSLASMNTSDVGKINNLHDKNLKDQANSNDKQIAILDKDESQQRSLNRQYRSLTCMFNILILLLTFILLNSCRVRFDIAY